MERLKLEAPKEAQTGATPILHLEEPTEVVWASDRMFPLSLKVTGRRSRGSPRTGLIDYISFVQEKERMSVVQGQE